MSPRQLRRQRARFRRTSGPRCFLLILCFLLAACGGIHTASTPPAAGATSDTLTERDLPSPTADNPGSLSSVPSQPFAGSAPVAPEPAQPMPPSVAAPAGQVENLTGNGAVAPAWRPLAERLAADGLAGPRVDALLSTLAATPSQSPMGRKMRELYMRRFFPKPPSGKPAPLYYKGVVTEKNARLCREFIAANPQAFALAEARYGVPPAIAVSLLFVETRLGKVLADVPENAFYTLASMAVSRRPQDISDWLPRLPGYERHLDWFAETMPKRADWAYKEVRALTAHLLHDNADPRALPSSIYGAVGLCQFMPSNIAVYGADGDGDGKVDLFGVPDAVASLSNYLAKHGWKPGISRARQHTLLMAYNHSRTYANTILALSDLVAQPPASRGAAAKR
ncbi:lytic murein transglycosylase [Desulfovibrio sp.]|uniref:lytic murein transglycosylase n=1 Tax=Desulfovibrio sp. TaxID=885 RepID=UPI0025C14414|nr:lytic murein transglycosylase [Desulfovibrio sp.]